ncbi:hypothetical protein [Streptomyces sp. NBC_01601]|uniref:hypothetical protein n=1 Tax=Streptomyces sp. NBC_01601 TaxID=2975892 RepID=UPI002E2806AE|nr:hypothetical protein [Streptomyces sp. NBC_01601]
MAPVIPTYRARYACQGMRDLQQEVADGKAAYEDSRQVTETVDFIQQLAGHTATALLQSATAYQQTSRRPESEENRKTKELLGEAAILAQQLAQKLQQALVPARTIK